MKFRSITLAILLAGTAPALAQLTPQQAANEKSLDASISAAEQMAWLKQMASAPNHVGSAHNKANAEFILSKFKEWGWDAAIERFDVLYPTPLTVSLELVAPTAIKLGGQEPTIAEDASSANLADALPPYVAFQGDGDVTADVVYVNYGLPADYDALARRGVDVRGKIALARYGGGWRGLKPKLAQEHGAVGTLIYSDPANDGYATADTYPSGGARPENAVQRGSVADMTVYPGDPTTPGYGSVPGAKHLARDKAATILKIPVLPISYGDAQKIFATMGGPRAPDDFRGALPLSYHLGGDGKTQVRLAVKSDWSLKPAYNVIAKLKGKDRPDEWVVRGNHHDGWVFGASDPLSGNVAMLSEAKALGAMAKAGWQPSRTIVYASWDAEEPMLLGSTEWVETHAAELQKKAVIYINTDGNGRGFQYAEGSHQWQHLVNQVARDVKDPQTGASVGDRARARLRANAYDGQAVAETTLAAAESGGDLPIGALGSGSDYSSFLQHLGIPALNIGYGGEDESGGAYHSIYDSYEHFTRFDDPGLAYGAALSQTTGRLVLRIADAPTPPVRFADFATTVKTYLAEVKTLVETRRKQDTKREALLTAGSFTLASDPKAPVTAALPLPATPIIELAALENAVTRLESSAKAFDAALTAKGPALTTAARTKLNALLRDIDQQLLIPEGLPGRSWYKHSIYAPGRFTGYGAKTLPGVREAIEERRFTDANRYAALTAAALDRYATRLDTARAVLG
ncbi:folate hydrolase [Polymorphobacter glacialis]|uniref:Folate hydrolase n=1 Tax=Sandarakinorhabdus glacialis TaxID=1614636 RepID=A0A916ZRJ7_9SPHN|nr:transferrin receptor-like dimerization domain-containing protein [Polymorphobacter glacialis]GGE10583.1 folate hydrolase [Polymorphobacter glacialis]